MTTPDHRATAAALLAQATDGEYGPHHPIRVDYLRRATVHAILALSEQVPTPSWDGTPLAAGGDAHAESFRQGFEAGSRAVESITAAGRVATGVGSEDPADNPLVKTEPEAVVQAPDAVVPSTPKVAPPRKRAAAKKTTSPSNRTHKEPTK